jgi:hypothetical protein
MRNLYVRKMSGVANGMGTDSADFGISGFGNWDGKFLLKGVAIRGCL